MPGENSGPATPWPVKQAGQRIMRRRAPGKRPKPRDARSTAPATMQNRAGTTPAANTSRGARNSWSGAATSRALFLSAAVPFLAGRRDDSFNSHIGDHVAVVLVIVGKVGGKHGQPRDLEVQHLRHLAA